MTHPPHVTCSDQLLGQTIADWLRDSLLPLPQDLKWDVSQVDAPVAWNDPREAFAQPGLRIRAGQPGGTVRIETQDPNLGGQLWYPFRRIAVGGWRSRM